MTLNELIVEIHSTMAPETDFESFKKGFLYGSSHWSCHELERHQKDIFQINDNLKALDKLIPRPKVTGEWIDFA